MISLKERYIATLIGGLIGDSIWAPFETDPAAVVAEKLRSLRGLRYHKYRNPWPADDNGEFLPAGRPTDDSDQTADLCFSLLQCDGIDPSHLRRSLQNSVQHGHSRLWKRGRATGAGGTTRRMLSTDASEQAEARANPIASNGSLMRSAPMALWLGPTPEGVFPAADSEDFELVKRMSAVTHVHPDSIAACWLQVRMLRNALAGRGIDEVEIQSPFDLRVFDYAVEVERGRGLPEDPGSFKNGWGGAEHTLKVALHAILTTDSFEECIRTVGLTGGDTDTYGAVAGNLAGAIYGLKAIPKQWRNIAIGADVMQNYAESIHSVYQGITV